MTTSPAAAAAIALVSCPPDHAERLATLLVEQGHAACVNVLPQIRSVYRWNGAVERADESLLLIKHRGDRFEALRQAVLAAHPYELPEIIAVRLGDAHPPYLDWIIASCT